MKKKRKDDLLKNHQENTPEPVYDFYGETDEEIFLMIQKRQEENEALKKLLNNLNTTISNIKSKKNV